MCSQEEVLVTPEMMAAGIEAADLIHYEWGETLEGGLVSRVFRAMDAARQREEGSHLIFLGDGKRVELDDTALDLSYDGNFIRLDREDAIKLAKWILTLSRRAD